MALPLAVRKDIRDNAHKIQEAKKKIDAALGFEVTVEINNEDVHKVLTEANHNRKEAFTEPISQYLDNLSTQLATITKDPQVKEELTKAIRPDKATPNATSSAVPTTSTASLSPEQLEDYELFKNVRDGSRIAWRDCGGKWSFAFDFKGWCDAVRRNNVFTNEHLKPAWYLNSVMQAVTSLLCSCEDFSFRGALKEPLRDLLSARCIAPSMGTTGTEFRKLHFENGVMFVPVDPAILDPKEKNQMELKLKMAIKAMLGAPGTGLHVLDLQSALGLNKAEWPTPDPNALQQVLEQNKNIADTIVHTEGNFTVLNRLVFGCLKTAQVPAVVKCIEIMLAAGADPNHKTAKGSTPLLQMALRPDMLPLHAALAEALVKSPKTDPNIRSPEGLTALHVATARGHYHLCNAILQHCDRVDLRLKTPSGRTALDLENDLTSVIELIEEKQRAARKADVGTAAGSGGVRGEADDALVRHVLLMTDILASYNWMSGTDSGRLRKSAYDLKKLFDL